MCKSIFMRFLFVVAVCVFLLTSVTEGVAQTVTVPAPTNLSATAGDGQVALSWNWTKPTDLADYTIAFHYHHLGINWTNTGSTNNNYTITGMTNGFAYTITLRCTASKDGTAYHSSNVSVSATPNIDAPADLAATAGDGQVTLNWTAVPESDWTTTQSADTYYEYSQNDGTDWTKIPNSTKTTATYTVTGLTNGTPYTFRVRARGAGGGGKQSDSQTATPMLSPPAAPTNFSATGGDGQVTLRWNAPSGPITRYEYSQDGGGWTSTGWTPASGTSTSRTVTGLTNGQTYRFRVRAVNSGGNGTASASVTATPQASVVPPPPPPPPPAVNTPPPAVNTLPLVEINPVTNNSLTVKQVDNPSVELSWNIPTGINPQTILEHQYSMDAGKTWTSTGSKGTSITINRDGVNTLPMNQFKVRAISLNADGTARVVTFILSAPFIHQCPVGWGISDGFGGRTRRALLYEIKLDMDIHNPISIYKPDWVAIYVHPDEGLQTLDGWKLQVAIPYNHHIEYLLTAENSVVVDAGFVEGGFAFIANPKPEEDPFPLTGQGFFPMVGMGFTGALVPGFDYRLYDETGRKVDFGIACYKRGDIFQVLKNMEDPRVLRNVLLETLDWDSAIYIRSEWTVPVPVNVPGAPSLQGVNLVGKWADLKKQ